MCFFYRTCLHTRVTKKCDVYSFGVVTLEILLGNHPGDFISSLTSSMGQNTLLKDVIDVRIAVPTVEEANGLVDVVITALNCVCIDPQKHPTMQDVSQKLSSFRPSAQPFHTVKFCHLMNVKM